MLVKLFFIILDRDATLSDSLVPLKARGQIFWIGLEIFLAFGFGLGLEYFFK